MTMRIKKIKTKKEYRSVTLRIDETLMKRIDEITEKEEVSRQKLITSILRQVLDDKKFVLELEELEE